MAHETYPHTSLSIRIGDSKSRGCAFTSESQNPALDLLNQYSKVDLRFGASKILDAALQSGRNPSWTQIFVTINCKTSLFIPGNCPGGWLPESLALALEE